MIIPKRLTGPSARSLFVCLVVLTSLTSLALEPDAGLAPGPADPVASPPPPAEPSGLAKYVGFDPLARLPTPCDPSDLPLAPGAISEVTRPYVEVHGNFTLWATPVMESVPGVSDFDAFRMRFAILRFDAHPSKDFDVVSRLAFHVATNALLDFQGTWKHFDALNVSAGQFRMPFGAAATTPVSSLVMPDTPRYVQDFLKSTFRDMGVMVHSGQRGLFDGLVHYRLAVMDGGGRLGVGATRGIDKPDQYLYVGRVLVDLGRVAFKGPKDRLLFGVSYAHSRDPAINSGSASNDKTLADSILGRRLVPYGSDRETQVVGADLTLAAAGVWLQAEWMYLDSQSKVDSTHVQATGASLEAGYTPQWRPYEGSWFSVAARGEYEDPNLATTGNENGGVMGGVEFQASPGIRFAGFGGVNIYHDASVHLNHAAPQVTFRAVYVF